jgi:hypothetical protein
MRRVETVRPHNGYFYSQAVAAPLQLAPAYSHFFHLKTKYGNAAATTISAMASG